jgi:hypothetical protein
MDWCQLTVAGADAPGLDVVDALARLRLAVQRAGGVVVVMNMCPDLADLLQLCGLTGQVGGQAEKRKDVCCIEEEGQFGDPPVGDLEDL